MSKVRKADAIEIATMTAKNTTQNMHMALLS